jgi:hypothetical protein
LTQLPDRGAVWQAAVAMLTGDVVPGSPDYEGSSIAVVLGGSLVERFRTQPEAADSTRGREGAVAATGSTGYGTLSMSSGS